MIDLLKKTCPLIVLLLSGVKSAFAADVFFCEGKSFVVVKDHVVKQYNPQNFKYSVTRDVVQFGEGGILDKTTMPLTNSALPNMWTALTEIGTASYMNGNFYMTLNSFDRNISISANCEKF